MLQSFAEQAFARWDHLADAAADPAGAATAAELRADLEPLCGLDGRVIAGAIAMPEFIRRRLADDADRLLEDLLTQMMPAPDLHWTHIDGMALLCFASPSRIVAEQTTFAVAAALERTLAQRLPALGGVAHVRHATAVFELDALAYELSRADVDFVEMVERRRQLADSGKRESGPSWIRGMRLRFQPFWNYQGARSGPDRCVTTLTGISDAQQSPADTVARVDFITFVRAAEMLQARLMENRRAALVVPIHYGSLQRQAWREDFFKLCAMVPQGCRRSMQLELLGTQRATPTELGDCVRRLRAFLPGIILRVASDAVPETLGKLGVTGISVDLGEPHRPGRAERLLAVVQRSAAERLASHAVGADTVEQAQAALTAGFTFIAGTAIHPVAQEPRMIQPMQTLPVRLAVRWSTAAPL